MHIPNIYKPFYLVAVWAIAGLSILLVTSTSEPHTYASPAYVEQCPELCADSAVLPGGNSGTTSYLTQYANVGEDFAVFGIVIVAAGATAAMYVPILGGLIALGGVAMTLWSVWAIHGDNAMKGGVFNALTFGSLTAVALIAKAVVPQKQAAAYAALVGAVITAALIIGISGVDVFSTSPYNGG